MRAPVPNLTAGQKALLRSLSDDWRRKSGEVDSGMVARLAELGLLDRKRERPNGRLAMTTYLRRTVQGRRALGLADN